jgi:carboxypeptidase C (cathepsin A)
LVWPAAKPAVHKKPEISLPEIGFKGYIPVEIGQYYYWGFYCHEDWKSKPLIIYFSSGFGASVLLSIFGGNGPYSLNDKDQIISSKFAWNKLANLLFIDAPLGSGLSIRNPKYKKKYLDLESEADFFSEFLTKFFAQHTQFAKSELIISGQAGGGG